MNITQKKYQSILWSQHPLRCVYYCGLVIFGALAIGVATQLSVALFSSAAVLQAFVGLLLGMIYGVRLGVLTMLAYLAMGCAGLPIFGHHQGGVEAFMASYNGYQLGLLPAIFFTAYFIEYKYAASTTAIGVIAFIGLFITYATGVYLLHHGELLQIRGIHLVGLFLFQSLVQVVLFMIIVPRCWQPLTRGQTPHRLSA